MFLLRTNISVLQNHRIAEVERTLWKSSPTLLLKAGSATAICSGTYPFRFGVFPWMGFHKLCWQLVPVFDNPHFRGVFLCLN